MKRFILPIFFMLIASGMYITYLNPSYGEIQALLKKKSDFEKSIVDASLAKQKIEELAAVEAGFPHDYEARLRTLLPDTIDPTRLVVEVNAMAARNGLRITTPVVGVTPNSKKVVLPYVKHTITFTVRAPYTAFRTYLRDLESNLSLRDVSSLSFSSQESDEDTQKYKNPELVPHDYMITLITYSIH